VRGGDPDGGHLVLDEFDCCIHRVDCGLGEIVAARKLLLGLAERAAEQGGSSADASAAARQRLLTSLSDLDVDVLALVDMADHIFENSAELTFAEFMELVYELRGGEPCRNLLNELNHKFGEFGVSFTSAIITDVRLSPDLDMRLQATTRFETEMKEMVKRHEHAVQAIDYDGSKKVDELKRAQDREIQDLVAEETRERLNREAQIVEQNDHKATDTIAAQEQAKVAEIKAQSELDAAKAQGNADAARLIAVAEAEAEQIKIAAKKTSEVRLLKSDNDVLCAKENAEAIRVLGQVEAKHAKNLADKREFEENLARFGAYKKLARNGRMMVSGKNGERIINELLGLGNANAQKGK